jgi:hypothetical protein
MIFQIFRYNVLETELSANSEKQIEKLRAWWWHRQGFAESVQFASPAAVFKETGWARSVGGCGPYLTLFSRAGISRGVADSAVANLEIHELPSARACTYVVPAADYSLALHLAQNCGPGEMRVAEKLGVTAKEIDKVCQAVVAALAKGPLDPDEIRKATGGVVRSLGPEGQKKGLTSTLPVALGQLQKSADIRRIPVNGRLDQQRYQYTLWRPNPLSKEKLTPEQAEAQLAQRFFHWIAPARLAEFQTFAGISLKAAKIAVEPLKLETLSPDDELLLPSSLRAEFEAFKPPKEPCYHFVTTLDSVLLLRRNLNSLLDPADIENSFLSPAASCAGGTLSELPSPAIVDRGRIVGLWEYDPDSESIAYVSFVKKNALLKKALAQMEEYVRTQLGDVRTFSLDSPKSRMPRIAAFRAAK